MTLKVVAFLAQLMIVKVQNWHFVQGRAYGSHGDFKFGALGDAPIKVQHSSGREIGVNIKYLDNPFGIKYKLNGFELGALHPFQIRRVCILFQKGWRDIDVALRQLFSISVHLYRSMTLSPSFARRASGRSSTTWA